MTTRIKVKAFLCAAAAFVAWTVGAAENVPWRFRHYRFKIDDCMGERIGVQLSEFRLLNGGQDVTPLRSGFSHGEGMDSSERSPIRQAVDGKLNTKWYSANGASGKDMSKCWLQIDYAKPQPVTAYDWATANDRWLGEIHPDKTCYTGKPPEGKTAIYPYLFTDWLQMHQPDGDSMNFTFRFAITSYAKGGGDAVPNGQAARCTNDMVARMCEDWLDPYAKWMRENNIPRFSRESVEEPPPGWTGLIEKPRAGHGEKDGQMYILWGAEMSPDFDHYELWRDGKFLANVTNEVPNGIPYRVARYEDLGLPTHSRHEYRIRKVWKDGRKDPLGEPFWGLTRYVQDATRDGVSCDGK